jgi:holo-[acyl-carrier protein] synthase
LGVGVDAVEVARIARALAWPRFAARVLTAKERALGLRPEQVAGRWAAKEAVAKAVGVHLGWQDLSVLNDDLGRPYVEWTAHGPTVHVSITHERDLAIAVVVAMVPGP